MIGHLVHGTWPAGGYLAHRYPRVFTPQPVWIDDGSDFRRDIEAQIPGIEWRPFRWSGENSEIDRRRAAVAFADALRRELDSAEDACHVVIAHSHGGNVALWGLGQLDEASRNRVAGLATMGTPFLHFASRRLSAVESFYLKAILAGQIVLVASIVAVPAAIIQTALREGLTIELVSIVGVLMFGVIAGYLASRKVRARAAELEQLKPAWPDRLASFVALRSVLLRPGLRRRHVLAGHRHRDRRRAESAATGAAAGARGSRRCRHASQPARDAGRALAPRVVDQGATGGRSAGFHVGARSSSIGCYDSSVPRDRLRLQRLQRLHA